MQFAQSIIKKTSACLSFNIPIVILWIINIKMIIAIWIKKFILNIVNFNKIMFRCARVYIMEMDGNERRVKG